MPGISPVMRPRRMVTIRSLTASTSGSSDEIIMTAMPRAASCTRIWCTSALAPTSTPRVGSSTISTLGSRASQRASTTFCWLPPDRPSIACSAEAMRIDSIFLKPASASRSRRSAMKPKPLLKAPSAAIEKLGRMPSAAKIAWRLRSSGTSPMPSAMASAGDCRRDRLAVERDRAGGDAVGAEDGARKLGAAGADQAGDAEDLAGLEVEVDALEHDGVRRFGIAHRAQAADRQAHRAGDVALRRPGIELGGGAADHLLDDPRQRHRLAFAVEVAGELAVAQHRHAVADRRRLLQPVRDEHDGDAVLAQPVHDRQQFLHLGLGQAPRSARP